MIGSILGCNVVRGISDDRWASSLVPEILERNLKHGRLFLEMVYTYLHGFILGRPAAQNLGLLWLNHGLLGKTVAHHFRLLGFPGNSELEAQQ